MAKIDDFIVYSTGLCYSSVCTTLSDKEEIAERMNMGHPTGISSRWQVATEPFKGGEPNPCPCPDHPGRRHFLLVC